MLFLDPEQRESVELVKLAELFYKHKIPLRLVMLLLTPSLLFMWPISFNSNLYQAAIVISAANWIPVFAPFYRIGFVFVVNTKDEIDGFLDAGVGFFRLLNYIADEYDLSQALMSMVSVSISHLWISVFLD